MKTRKKELKEKSKKLHNMIDFKLVRKKPSGLELRAYLYQIMIDNFGLSKDMNELIQNHFPQAHDKGDLNSITEQDIRKILQNELILPEEIFFFKKDYDPELITEGDYKSIPDIFTRICQVSFDRGGLIVLERYNSQIYELYDAKGKYLIGPCHDLELGMDGKVMLRTSESIFWEFLQYSGKGLKDLEIYGPFDSPSDFPYLGDRDLIPEILPIGSFIETEYDQSVTLTDEEVSIKLKNDSRAYKYLEKYYKDNEELGLIAVNSNLYAFTFLSKKLQCEKEFVIKLILQKDENQHLYDYLNDNLKKDIGIVKLCIKADSGIIRNIAPVSDRELMEEALIDDVFNLRYASEDLKTDKNFILDLVRKEWRILDEASKTLLSDSDFIHEAICCFNINQENPILGEDQDSLTFRNKKNETIDISTVVNYLVSGYPRVLKHISPTSDMEIICKCLEYTEEADIHFIIDCISDDLKQTKAFWVAAVQKSLYMLKNAPLDYKQDEDVVLSAIRYHGELIEFADENLIKNPKIFLEAIHQINNRRGGCDPGMISHLIPFQLTSDRSFLLQAIKDYPRIFELVPLEIRSDRNFMLQVIEKTYGWIIEYVTPDLQCDRQFILAAAKRNKDILGWLPEHYKEDKELIEMLNNEGIESDLIYELQRSCDDFFS